jgi:hypothetical protein
VVLQNSADSLKGEPGSCIELYVIPKGDGNKVTGVKATMFSDISEELVQEPTTLSIIKTEPKVSGVSVPVVSVAHISNKLYPELPICVSVCP